MNDKYINISRYLNNTANCIENNEPLDFLKFYETMETLFAENNFRRQQEGGVESILVVRLNDIGDFILTSGFIRELRANYPYAFITLVVNDYTYNLAENCPYVNEVLHFDNRIGDDFGNFALIIREISNFVEKYLWKRHFSLAFCIPYMSYKAASLFMTYLSGAFERIGYPSNMERLYQDEKINLQEDVSALMLTNPVINPKEIIAEPARVFYLLNAAGLQINCTDMELWYSAEDILTAESVLGEKNHFEIVVGIGAGEEGRKYPIQKYLTAFQKLIKQNKNLRFVIVGGNSEIEGAEILQKNLPKDSVLNLAGKLNLSETAAVISKMNLYIGNDTGTMLMAAAAKLPVIAIYRQAKDKYNDNLKGIYSELDRFPPYQTISIILRPKHALADCKEALSYGGCKELNPHCIAQVKPEEIIDAFNKILYLIENSHQKSLNFLSITRNYGQIKNLLFNS